VTLIALSLLAACSEMPNVSPDSVAPVADAVADEAPVARVAPAVATGVGGPVLELAPPRDDLAQATVSLTGPYSAGDALPADGTPALALCDGALVASPVHLAPVHDAAVDEIGVATGHMLSADCGAIALFTGIPTLQAGPVQVATTSGQLEARGGQVELTLPGGDHARVRVETVGETGYRVLLDSADATTVLVRQDETDHGQPMLIWAGDLDGDQHVDLLLDASQRRGEQSYALYLSSEATAGPVARVAVRQHQMD